MRKLFLSSSKSLWFLIATRYGGLSKEGTITNLWDYLGCICWGIIKIASVVVVGSYLGSFMIEAVMAYYFNMMYLTDIVPKSASIFFGTVLWGITIGAIWYQIATWSIVNWWELMKPEFKEINKTTKEIKQQLSEIRVSFTEKEPELYTFGIITTNQNVFRVTRYEGESFEAGLWVLCDFVLDYTNNLILKNRWGTLPHYELMQIEVRLLDSPIISMAQAFELASKPIDG